MKIFKKMGVFVLILMMLSTVLFQIQTASAAEGGITLGVSGMQGKQLIRSSGISGTTNYAADGMSFNFRYALNFLAKKRILSTVFQFEVEPALIPYVDHIAVNGLNKKKGFFNVVATMPGQFYFSIMDVAKKGYAIVDITVYLKTSVNCLPNKKYAYGLGLVDSNLGFQYVYKTRVTGVVEQKPVQYVTLSKNFGLYGSYLGFYLGRPLPSDNIIELQYNVYEKCTNPIKKTNFVFKFDPCLTEYIDHVDFYNAYTGKFVVSSDMTTSGTIRVPAVSVFPKACKTKYWPINVKVYLKRDLTLSDITLGTFSITAYAELAASHGFDILKSSLCTVGIYNGACVDPNASYIDQSQSKPQINIINIPDDVVGEIDNPDAQ